MHPYRSILYMPGSNARALDKARTLPADALILDLEDAVAAEAKDAARDLVAAAVAEGGYGERKILIRVNGPDTPWGAADLDMAIAAAPDAILLPKVGLPTDITTVATEIARRGSRDTRIWAMIETPQGVLNTASIATSSPMLEGFVLGTNDLLKDLQAQPRADRLALIPSLALCLLAARAVGLVCVDGVYNAFRDDDGLRAECAQGRDLGFDGKTLIHPAQIAIANTVFAPDDDQIALAKRQVAAFEEADSRGEGVAVLDGRIVENLHVETARQTLAKAAAIARMM
jgi:(3S)-malyl-CoA thioesterase